jgi:hypothetical protein
MSPSENNVLDIIGAQQERAKTTRGYKFKTMAEMTAAPINKNWLIKGVLARGESSAWIAAPGKMKSALMAQASICVAAGLDWHGFRNKGACGVVYFAIEREDLVRRRMLAHVARLGLTSPPIVVVGDLIDPKNAKKIIATIQEAGELLGVPIGLAVFDTFAKLIAAGGGDENSAKDQGAVFTCLQIVKNFTRSHVAIIGHTGKDESKGQRGSNAALGDCDLQVTITGEGIRTANVTKNNDGPEGNLFSFCSEVHTFGIDEDGDPITVNIVSSEQPATQAPTVRETKLKPNQQTMFGILHSAGAAGLSTEDWYAKAKEVDIGIKRKADLYDIREFLKRKGLVRQYGEHWTVQHG